MAVGIERDQTTCQQVLPMLLQDLEHGRTSEFGRRAWHTKLNNARQAGSAQCENSCEIQILPGDHSTVPGCVIEDGFVRISDLPDVFPVNSVDTERREIIPPARGKIFIKDQLHDASNSCVSEAETSAANSRAARIESKVR